MTQETNVINNKYHFVIEQILREERRIYLVLLALQEAVEFKGRIPKSYFRKYKEYSFNYYFEAEATKAEARAIRNAIIQIIVNSIKSHTTHRGERMLHDHYARLFHGLAILKVEKDTDLLPGTMNSNFIYSAMYCLWRADDGSIDAQKAILGSAWFLAEHYKYLTEGTPIHCIEDLKC